MSKTINFIEIGNTGFLESEYYVFEKNEVISIFKDYPAYGGNVFKKIENHEIISMEMPEERRIKVHYWPDKSSDRYVMQITMPKGLEAMLPEKLLSYLNEKEPTKFKMKKNQQNSKRIMDKDVALEALVQAIPYVGSSLATLYFGTKEKKRYERLESFYRELISELEDVKSSISSIDEHSSEELKALIEEIHNAVETEKIDSKKKYYKNLYKKSLIHPVKNNFNERKYFLDLISQLTQLHFDIIALLFKQNKNIPANSIQANGVEPHLVRGFLQQLENYGLVDSEIENIQFTAQSGSINRKVQITELGKNFHYFCLED